MTREPASLGFSEPDYSALIAAELDLAQPSVAAIIDLIDEGCTVPFISRYRKEATGGIEDVGVNQTLERLKFHREFFDRKKVILETISEQGKLTPELQATIEQASTKTELEDLYLPYRPKRRTRATVARERGLEPLADRMWAQQDRSGTPEEAAVKFIDPDKEVETAEQALQGARDIVAERVVETAEWRERVRRLTWERGTIATRAARGKADTVSKFSDYYEYDEPVRNIPSHRILAILRGEKEGFISCRIQPDPETAKSILSGCVLKEPESIWLEQVRVAAEDAYDRLLKPQLSTEVRGELKSAADLKAIEVFAANLRDLLMAPPFGTQPVLAIDPGFRTGCKVAVLDGTGQLLEHGVVYPTVPRKDIKGTESALDNWFEKYPGIAAVAVGNGTGGRETFSVGQDYLKSRPHQAVVIQVNESGASVYSASEVAREELPDFDVTVRGAVSIGRRLQDPLAELVKIDPKSIGVGQYQHDVDQKLLKQKLDDVVVSCVNQVGVDVNTASVSLLGFVSGLGTKVARAIVARRDKDGAFKNRQALLDVTGLGAKTFEQAAGFLRIKGDNPLDNSAVHPERYRLVRKIAADLDCRVGDLIGDSRKVQTIELKNYIDDTVGLYTLEDIVEELEKPGRDPRQDFEIVEFHEDIHELTDLSPGLVLNGVVTNVTNFGAFVDIGVHQDGLVHVSQIANRFVRDPADELQVGQKVRVKVLQVDVERRRIGLSMKDCDQNAD
jgi:uncharacterized protein